jgi:hypothetical protein
VGRQLSANTETVAVTLLLACRRTFAVVDTSNSAFEKHLVRESLAVSQVIPAFHWRYGKPSPHKAARHVSMGETRLIRNFTCCSQWSNTLNGDVCHFSRFHCAIATQIRAGTTSGTRRIRSTMFDSMKDRAMMSFRPVIINEPGDGDTKHAGARALLLQRFPPALSRE